jgi:hypothetical protein
VLIGLALVACTGRIGAEGQNAEIRDGAMGGSGRDSPAQGGANAPSTEDDDISTSSAPQPMLEPETSAPPLERAFSCQPGATLPPQRLWRLSAVQYVNTLTAFFGGRGRVEQRAGPPPETTAPWDPPNPADRFTNLSWSYGMGEGELRASLQAAADLAARFIADLRGNNQWCAPGKFAECVRDIATSRGSVLFSRPLTEAEVNGYVELATANAGTLGEERALATVAQAMLMSPFFVFRRELGVAAAGSATARLDPYEVASALAYSLTDYPPDDTLWRAAGANALSTAADIRPHVERLLAAPPPPLGGVNPPPRTVGDHTVLARFLHEFLPFERASAVFKDPKKFPDHKPELLVSEASAFVREILNTSSRAKFLSSLLTSPVAFVHDETAASYGFAADALNDPTCVKDPNCRFGHRMNLSPARRAGILTQPAFLTAFSKMEETEPVQRGLFIARNLLCRHVPELPIGVVPQLPAAGTVTTRERLALHTKDPSCAACHHMMDPLGLPFEVYDHMGRERSTEAGMAIDASGTLTGSGSTDGDFKTPVELIGRLAQSPAVRQCFVRNAFTFWLGRQDGSADGCTMADALAAFEKNDGDLVGLIASLFTSNAFLNRRTAP